MSNAPLEVFHTLGLLHAHKLNGVTDINRPDAWRKTNYVLVRNVYDNSIWTLWRKAIPGSDGADDRLAKDDICPQEYAVFPGIESVTGTVIYAKLADSWNELGSDAVLRLSRISRASLCMKRVVEPLIVKAKMTEEGRLRREQDFRLRI